MVHQNSVSFDEIVGRLLPLDQVRERLATTEPLSELPFKGGAAQLRLDEGWAAEEVKPTDYTKAYLLLPGGVEYQLTRQAALEVGAQVGIPRRVQETSDPDVLVPLINSRMVSVLGDDRELKALGNENRVLAVTRGTVSPFPNLAILDIMVAGLEKKYGKGEIYADYKFSHDLEHTGLRLIVPGHQRVITGSPVADDTWSAGLDFANSLIGLRQTQINGQLFRWWCTNGCTDTLHSVGGLSRRGTSYDDAMAWAAATVEEVLGGLEEMLDHVQSLTDQPIAGSVRDVLDPLFAEYGVPSRDRHRVLEEMAEDDVMTGYSLMQAITAAANGDDIPDRDRQRLMRMGGSFAATHSVRCSMGRVHRVVDGHVVGHADEATEQGAENAETASA